MNIALLSAANSIHTQKIAGSLAELGHTVTLFSLAAHRDRDGEYDSRVQIRYLPKTGGTAYVSNAGILRSWLRAGNFDVLNAHYASGYGTLGGLTGFRPYVLSVWGSDVYDFPYQSPLNRVLLRRNLKKADLLLSTSDCMARQTAKFVPGKKIITTPFGVDTSVFVPAQRPEDNVVNIGFIKAVSEKYGIEYLLRAFRKVKDACPGQRLRLLVYGGGDQMEAMKALAVQLEIQQEVTFFGRIPHDDVPAALAGMDIFCVPSTLDSESFGVSAVEAMACAIPCVVSDVDGLSEVMADGETGFIVPRRNADALAEKIILLAGDARLRKALGQNGRERVQARYEWSDNIKTIENALRSAVRK